MDELDIEKLKKLNLGKGGSLENAVVIKDNKIKVRAREEVISLINKIGLTGWHAGPLCNSAAAEALTSILIAINKNHEIKHSGIKITGV